MKHCFTLTVSADYQQSKLIPYWWRREQPGSMHYTAFKRVSRYLWYCTFTRTECTLSFDEHIGPKTTEHTVSFHTQYWRTTERQHPWNRRLAIFLDYTTSTSKNKHLFAWAMEMVSTGALDYLHISFMLAVHTRFAPDCMYSSIRKAYKSEDIFSIDNLKGICDSVQQHS